MGDDSIAQDGQWDTEYPSSRYVVGLQARVTEPLDSEPNLEETPRERNDSGRRSRGRTASPKSQPLSEKQVERIRKELQRTHQRTAADTLATLLKNERYRETPASSMYLWLDPQRIYMAAELRHSASVRRIEHVRNLLVLLPLFLTWGSLGIAAFAYQQHLAAHPEMVTVPFLSQWEQTFGMSSVSAGPLTIPLHFGFFSFTFSGLAATDMILFALLFLLTLFAQNRHSYAVKRAMDLRLAVEGILQEMSFGSFADAIGEQADAQEPKWAVRVNKVIAELREAMGAVGNAVGQSQRQFATTVSQFESAIKEQQQNALRQDELIRRFTHAAAELTQSYMHVQQTDERIEKRLSEWLMTLANLTYEQSRSNEGLLEVAAAATAASKSSEALAQTFDELFIRRSGSIAQQQAQTQESLLRLAELLTDLAQKAGVRVGEPRRRLLLPWTWFRHPAQSGAEV